MMTILLLASLAVVIGGLAVIPALELAQEAEAKGCRTSQAFNASKGRCLFPPGQQP